MTILLDPRAIDARRAAAAGGLHPLARSLAADLEIVAARDVWLPPEKARMTRGGGWCPRDGTRLDFDPFAPRAHRCPRCGTVYDGDDHYRSWIVAYQLWVAERAVHGAVLALVAGRDDLGAFADRVLAACADAYLRYPNADNVLGPTRPFFSTYLESIWLLQLCVAQSLREAAGASDAGVLRERVVAPSAALVASYNEGASNRQVWNNAALLAAGALLGTDEYDGAYDGPGGLLDHVAGGLLADGSWYEGENYHLFAHRGLWYAATLAERRGAVLPPDARRRIDDGFVVPFLTALPDYTFPARRDSAYRVSLRQWRFAELAELGVTRSPRPELLGALRTLYDPAVPRVGTERPRSTAETERNAPATGMTRADLGWRSLLFARETLPDAADWAPGSVLLPAQGIAVLRRRRGELYAALDYGRSGGGHGHPDRLNVLLSDGDARWQDDVGTGSYTEPTLHWYRSTLAHAAPLVDGRSQDRVDGELLAYDERGDFGIVRATAPIAERIAVERTLVAGPDYVIVTLDWWSGDGARTVDLPIPARGEVRGVDRWTAGALRGGDAADDGFAFVDDVETAAVLGRRMWRLDAIDGARAATLWVCADDATALFRFLAPGPPGEGGRRRMHLLRAIGERGRVVQLWSTRGAVHDVAVDGEEIVVARTDGGTDRHSVVDDEWVIRRERGEGKGGEGVAHRVSATSDGSDESTTIRLRRAGGPPQQHDAPSASIERDHPAARRTAEPQPAPRVVAPYALSTTPLVANLAEPHYRRSELSWRDAGAPTARLSLFLRDRVLVVDVVVTKSGLLNVPAELVDNPLDNEHPDSNADGVQLHVALPSRAGETELAWIVVPAAGGARVSALTPAAASAGLRAAWTPSDGGWTMRLALPLPEHVSALALDVAINETSPARERRRGQLLLSGGAGDYVYLRGARLARERFLTFTVPHV